MGINHVMWAPYMGENGAPEKYTYHYKDIKEISNDSLMWQVRLCETPGVIEVIAAFANPADAITFMTIIAKNGTHGKVFIKEPTIALNNSRGQSYSIEHNSSTKFVELEYERDKNI